VTATPQRIQQKRVKYSNIRRFGLALNGLPTKSVVRRTKWGNPFEVDDHGREEAIRLFCEYVDDYHDAIRRDLRGKNVACYCRLDEMCHADVLLAIANAEA
jgi:valyl-tRNA synthetase